MTKSLLILFIPFGLIFVMVGYYIWILIENRRLKRKMRKMENDKILEKL